MFHWLQQQLSYGTMYGGFNWVCSRIKKWWISTFRFTTRYVAKEGVAPKRIYEDFASGKKEDRPGLEACLKALQPGNTLVVWKLDRLGRNLVHLNQIINYLNDNRIALKVLDSTMGRTDTTTLSGKLMFKLFSVLAEYERNLIREALWPA